MNCPECGAPYAIGGNPEMHRRCRERREARERRESDIEEMLAWWRENVRDAFVGFVTPDARNPDQPNPSLRPSVDEGGA